MEEEDRSSTVMLFGLAEETDEDLEAAVNDLFIQLGEKPRCDDVIRLGKTASTGGSKTARQVKITLPSTTHVSALLSKASRLKDSSRYSGVFISPDRSPDQRVLQRKLVSELVTKRKQESDKRHFIRRGVVCSKPI